MQDKPHQRLLLFGDQTDNMVPCIRNLYVQSKKSMVLARFLQECSDVLQVEIAKLTPSHREALPPFFSVLDLAEHPDSNAPGSLAGAYTSTILMYIGRLGELIIYAENDPSLLLSELTILGLCTGFLSAAVGSVATNVSELVHLASEFIPLVVRVCTTTYERSRMVEESQETWTQVVRDMPAEELQGLIDEFNTTSVSRVDHFH